MLRRDRRGAMSILVTVAIVAVVLVVALVAYAAATDPTRPMNDCGGKAVSYARAAGTYQVWVSYATQPGGSFQDLSISVTDLPAAPNKSGGWFPFASFGGNEGQAFVKTTVTGPGGVSVAEWESKHTAMDFTPTDKIAAAPKPGDFVGGLACFVAHGQSTWHFALIWADHSGAVTTVATADRTVAV